MKNITLKYLLVSAIIAGSLILRFHNYDKYPQRGATSDEYTYSFLGLSLIKEHLPISWSYFSAYKHKYDLTINKIYFPIVYPYFDHPPLNGLLVAGWSLVNGGDTFEKIDLKTIRLVPIFLSTLSSLLVFLISLRLYNHITAVWALLIYSTTTLFVMNGRVVLAENLLTTLLLGSIYYFGTLKNNFSVKSTILIASLCGLSFWTKELGIISFLTIVAYFLYQKIYNKQFLILTLAFISYVLLYVAYGYYFDAQIFWGIIRSQANRIVGPDTLQMIAFTPIIINKIYLDGWYFYGLFALFAAFTDFKKHYLLAIPAFIYLLLLIFSLSQQGDMGWYSIPLYPFLSILGAYFLQNNTKSNNLFILTMLLFVGLYELKYLYEPYFGLTTMQFRIFMTVFFAPVIIFQLFRKDKLLHNLTNFWFYIFILGNIILTYNYIHPE